MKGWILVRRDIVWIYFINFGFFYCEDRLWGWVDVAVEVIFCIIGKGFLFFLIIKIVCVRCKNLERCWKYFKGGDKDYL